MMRDVKVKKLKLDKKKNLKKLNVQLIALNQEEKYAIVVHQNMIVVKVFVL